MFGKKKKEIEINKDIVIGDLLKVMPQAAEVLMRSGMHCVYCPSAINESLEEACMVHGMDCDTILDELLADGVGMLAALLAAGNLSFWLCDRAVGALTRYYRLILKKKLKFLH